MSERRRWLPKSPFAVGAWLSLLLAVPVVLVLRRNARTAPLPTYGQLPRWSLTDQQGRPFGTDDLRGRVWVADFFFTSCPSICPRLTRHMGRVRERLSDLGDRAKLVSFTVDPVVDTPQRLAGYGREHRIDATSWRMVTGDASAIQRVAVDGFHLATEVRRDPATGREANYNILHGSHILLVDGHSRIRGFYRADDEGLEQVSRDAHQLAARGE